jgi:hypothetical protein
MINQKLKSNEFCRRTSTKAEMHIQKPSSPPLAPSIPQINLRGRTKAGPTREQQLLLIKTLVFHKISLQMLPQILNKNYQVAISQQQHMRQCLFAKKSCNLAIVHLSSSPRDVQKKTETNSHLSSSLRDEEEEENRPTRSRTAASFSEGISEIPK